MHAARSCALWRQGHAIADVAFYSTRRIAQLEMQVQDTLRQIPDYFDSTSNIITRNRIKHLYISLDDASVRCTLEPPNGALLDVASQYKIQATQALEKLEWVKSVAIDIQRPKPRSLHANRSSALAHVADIIAVSSCKGGVGKSTVAVNLAFSLAKRGALVGILDADIYGPSLPTMVSPKDSSVRRSKEKMNCILPLEYNSVKLMSFGYVNQKAAPGAGGSGAAIMRGPMVSKIVDQLVLATDWGSLDFLIIDMPPGTGDIQMSLAQQLSVTATVIVTTPQRLSLIDVEKGIKMFKDMKVPTAAVVENMSYFDCIHGHRHFPFGKSQTLEHLQKYQIQNFYQLPILEQSSVASDSGRPLVLHDNVSDDALTAYSSLAECVARQAANIKTKAILAPALKFDPTRGIVIRAYTATHAQEAVLSPKELRAECRCAQCIDEFTGQTKLNSDSIPHDIVPKTINRKGNYAYAIVWSDTHASSLYTDEHLLRLLTRT